ncbi:hypothetical protein [Stenotrophomonas terrae]|nr:hypothetical protein [Stenotrophomonas terrae]
MHADLFDEFGCDGKVSRAGAQAVPVRLIINRAASRIGDYGQVVGRMTTAIFMRAQWSPAQGDVVVWEDQVGVHQLPVENPGHEDDGFAVTAVLHG